MAKKSNTILADVDEPTPKKVSDSDNETQGQQVSIEDAQTQPSEVEFEDEEVYMVIDPGQRSNRGYLGDLEDENEEIEEVEPKKAAVK